MGLIPPRKTASAAQGRGRTDLDHWALFTSGLPLLASQTQVGPFLLRLNRAPPPTPSCPMEGFRPSSLGSTHPSRQLPLAEPSPGCLMDATDYIMAKTQLPTGEGKWAQWFRSEA